MKACKLENSEISVSLFTESGTLEITDKSSGRIYSQISSGEQCKIENISADRSKIRFDAVFPMIRLTALVELENSDVVLSLESDAKFTGTIKYPLMFDAEHGDVALIPLSGGFAFPVDDPKVELPASRQLFVGWLNSMDFFAIMKGDNWLISAIETGADAVLSTKRGEDGMLRTQVEWVPEKGRWGYSRKVRYMVGAGGITGACKAYRALMKRKGFLVTLKEKLKKAPNLHKLIGAANVWLFTDKPRDIAEEMKSLGLDRVLWSQKASADDVHYIRDQLGYLTSRYDMYRDVTPEPIRHLLRPGSMQHSHHQAWPDDIIVKANGEYQECWQLTGIDGKRYHQHAMCDMMAVKYAMQEIPADTAEKGYECRFVDTTISTPFEECYSPAHPMTRSDCMRYRNALLRYISDIGLVCGSEDGHETFVPSMHYSEGLMSPGFYRHPDSGHKMWNRCRGEDIEPKIIDFQLNPVYRAPLWELVFHDCMVSYWYWGDGSLACPELLSLRDLFNNLYGTPPLYTMIPEQWEVEKQDIKASYDRTSDISKAVGYAEMTAFEYLSDDKKVQRTTFSNGITVTVNFTDEPFSLSNGVVIAPKDRYVTGMEI